MQPVKIANSIHLNHLLLCGALRDVHGDALHAVQVRGTGMAAACTEGTWTMAALRGLPAPPYNDSWTT